MLKLRKNKTFSPKSISYSRGFTLAEVIIAMAIGTIIIAGALNIFVTNTKASNLVLESTHINQEMRTLLEIMASDIRKAGYWGGAKTAAVNDPNPFGIDTIDNSNCILFTYDINDSQVLDPVTEEYGFRLNDGVIESRKNGDNCTLTNTWDALSDSTQVEITDLIFTAITKCTNVSDTPPSVCNPGAGYVAPDANDVLVEMHSINIELSGKLKAKPEITLNLKDTIIVANDATKIAL